MEEVSPAQAAAWIGAAFEDLAGASVRRLGAGWDNVVYLVDERWVFRFPRRDEAVPCLRREVEVVPVLAPQLPVPISAPTRVAERPVFFAGYRALDGTPAGADRPPEAARAALAEPLGAFLRALHHAEAPGRPGPPVDALGKADFSRAARSLRLRLRRMARQGHALDAAAIRARAAAWSSAPPPVRRCWVHGDLYPRHLLLDARGRLAGVIDWGDVHFGDPALDLSLALGWLPARAAPRFFDAYGPVDAATLERAWFRVLYYGVVLLDFGSHLLRDPELARVGEAYLARALARP
jgi:aminoglycoside phosphotransferase (APT) family kinase protein